MNPVFLSFVPLEDIYARPLQRLRALLRPLILLLTDQDI